MNTKRGTSAWLLAALASPAMPMFALAMPLVVYVPPFYAEKRGLGLALVGTIVTVGKLFDVLTDPLVGSLSDRLRTRYGRRRPMLAASVPLLVLATWRVFMPPEDAGASYLFVWLLVLYLGWTLATTALFSWGAEIEQGYDERTRVMGCIQAANVLGQTSVLAIPTLIAAFSSSNEPNHTLELSSMGTYVIVLLPISVVVALAFVPEPHAHIGPRVAWREAFALVVRNVPLRWLLAADLFAGLAVGIIGSLSLFFVGHALGLPTTGSASMLLFFGGGLVMIPAWMHLSKKVGKHRALAFSSLYSVVTFPAVVLFLPSGIAWAALAGFLILGLSSAVTQLFTRSIMADVIDQDRIEAGTDRTGLFMALMGTTVKLGIAFGPGIAFPLLDWIGFSPAGDNTPTELRNFRFLLAGLAVAVHGGIVACMWNFPLDRKRHDALQARLRSQTS